MKRFFNKALNENLNESLNFESFQRKSLLLLQSLCFSVRYYLVESV